MSADVSVGCPFQSYTECMLYTFNEGDQPTVCKCVGLYTEDEKYELDKSACQIPSIMDEWLQDKLSRVRIKATTHEHQLSIKGGDK